MSDEENEEGEVGYQVTFHDEPTKTTAFLPAKSGVATAKFVNGDSYEGEYSNGARNGKGTYKFASGAKYVGEYVNNKKQGMGSFFAPDGGVYEGQWADDKRQGTGTYTYPNGDVYKGGWKNGKKHGPGVYTYNKIQSQLVGTWSNNRLVEGKWSMHDGSRYIGSFLANQPAGDGLYMFSDGNSAFGKYEDNRFLKHPFSKPHPNTRPPEPRKADPLRKAERAIDKAVIKSDHSNNMYELEKLYDGVPNFRKVGGVNVFGCGQPTIEGLKALIEAQSEEGAERVVMINLRSEPVVFVNNVPYTPRDKREINEHMTLVGLDTAMMASLEERVADNIRFSIKKKGGLHDYIEEVWTKDKGAWSTFTNEQRQVEVTEPDQVKSITAVHEALKEEDVPIEYFRVPLQDERAPALGDFDALVKLVKGVEAGALLGFNCHQGFGRTSTGMVVGALLRKQINGPGEGEGDEAEEEGGDEGDEGDGGKKKKKGEEVKNPYNPEAPDYRQGQYKIVMDLVAALGARKDAEKAEKEARAKAEKEREAAEAAAEAKEAAGEGDEGDEGDQKAKGGEEEEEKAAPDEGDEGDAAANEGDEGDAKGGDEGDAKAEEAPKEVKIEKSTYGFDIKALVDDLVDQCGALVNLRECILQTKVEHDKAEESDKRKWKRLSVNYLERYYMLLVFAAYVKENAAPTLVPGEDEGDEGSEETFAKSFAKWVEENPQYTEPLGTRLAGGLAEFAWV